MANKLNLIGEQFGQLTVLQDSGKRTSNGTVLWLCQCSCGNTKEVTTVNLRRGSTKSCGCYRQQKASKDLTNQIFGRLTPYIHLKNLTIEDLMLPTSTFIIKGDFDQL